MISDEVLLNEIKTRLCITGTYHDALLLGYIKDVKAFMLDGGISSDVVDSENAIGVIALGVRDMWNGEGNYSNLFVQRFTQLNLKE